MQPQGIFYIRRCSERTEMRIRKKTELLNEDEILLIADVSDALAHPVRVKLFNHILDQNKDLIEVCNGDLVEAFDYSQSTISQHMKKLVKSGLIQSKKVDKKTVYFSNIGKLNLYLAATRKFNSFQR